MTPTQFRATLAALGWSQVRAARILKVEPRTVRRWASGETKVPNTVETLLKLLSNKLKLEDVR